MHFKGFLLLLLLTTAAVAGVYRFAFKPASEAADTDVAQASAGYLLEEFRERVNELAAISITTADASITLELVDGNWGVRERGGYPVDFAKVKILAFALTQLEVEEPKTAKPENHALLGVEAPDAEDSDSTHLVLRDANGKDMASLILGDTKYRRGSQALFVRHAAGDQVYLCKGKISAADEVRGWVDPEILSLESDRVQAVRILHRDGEEILIARSTQTPSELEVTNVPLAREIAVAGNASSIGSALNRLTLEDVRPAEEVDFETEALAETHYRAADGLLLTVTSATFEEQTWIKLEAGFAAPDEDEVEPASGDESGEEGDGEPGEAPTEPELSDPATVRAEVAELNARLQGWAFAIPMYKSNLIAKHMEDLLKTLDDTPEPDGDPMLLGNTEVPPHLQELLREGGLGGAGFKTPQPMVEKPPVLPPIQPEQPELDPAEELLPVEDPPEDTAGDPPGKSSGNEGAG